MKKSRNTILKRAVAVAACAALVATVGIGMNYKNRKNNPFIITAYAAELEEDKSVPIVLGGQQSWTLGGDEDTGKISYDIQTDFLCQGENIDTITYHINKGAFDISELEEQSILVSEVEYGGEEADLSSGGIGVMEDTEGNTISVSRLLQEYTVSYDAQTNDTTFIVVCGIKSMEGAIDTIWGENPGTCEEIAAVYDQLLDGVEISCTVNYKDGTSASQIITVGGQVMTFEEAGMCKQGDTYDTGQDWRTKDAFFAFRLKA